MAGRAGQPRRMGLKLHPGPSGVPWGGLRLQVMLLGPSSPGAPGWRGSGQVSPGSWPAGAVGNLDACVGSVEGWVHPQTPGLRGGPGTGFISSFPREPRGHMHAGRRVCMWTLAASPDHTHVALGLSPLFSRGSREPQTVFQTLLGGPSQASGPKPLGLAMEVGIQTCRLKYFNISDFSFWREEDWVTQKAQGGAR